MIRLSAHGYRVVVDLHDHHLAIKRSVNFVGAPNEQIIPLASIKSVGFRRPAFLMSGRITLTLSGGRAQDSGTVADENTVFFSKDHLTAFEQLFQLIQSAIATPSIEQMVMYAQRDRQERVSGTRSEPQQALTVLKRIDRLHQSYDDEGGTDLHDGASSEQNAYHHPSHRRRDEPPVNPTVGGWWGKMPVVGRISLVGVPLFLMVVMCSGPQSSASFDADTPAVPVAQPATYAYPSISQAEAKSSSAASLHNQNLDFNGIAYHPAENAQCDGETWMLWRESDGNDRLVWSPKYTGPSSDYQIFFRYVYDGRNLNLFDGEKHFSDDPIKTEHVKDRTLTLIHAEDGSWLLNGRRMLECAG